MPNVSQPVSGKASVLHLKIRSFRPKQLDPRIHALLALTFTTAAMQVLLYHLHFKDEKKQRQKRCTNLFKATQLGSS